MTTVRQPVGELAAEAARLLSRRPSAAEPGPRRTVRLAPHLVVRASSAPAGASSAHRPGDLRA
ncbi:hypothetical protein NCG97_04265 [Streptomyces lydicamycinicus]|nr:hypothetical protein NCG97_04265 [Streptomyces lydicamycinicus]